MPAWEASLRLLASWDSSNVYENISFGLFCGPQCKLLGHRQLCHRFIDWFTLERVRSVLGENLC